MNLPSLSPEHFVCRILAIDNGTSLVGFTVADYNILTDVMELIHCETYQVPSNYATILSNTCQNRGRLSARLELIEKHYIDLLEEFTPSLIGCESPFGHRMMNAFRVLTVSIEMFDRVSYEHMPYSDFIRISPLEAKRAICGDGKLKVKKEDVHKYIFKDKKIITPEHIDLRKLGPDALDSITVAKAMGKYMVL